MIKWEESVQIYERWLAGVDIQDLSREFHHRRRTIEDEIRWQAQGQVERIQALNREIEVRTGERNDLGCAIQRWEIRRHVRSEGRNATRKWCADYSDSIRALNNCCAPKLLAGILWV